MSERSAEQAPWWLQGGTETCDFCLASHWIEVEVRCAACDRPGCLHCMVVVREAERVWCRECAPEDADGRGGRAVAGGRA